MIVGQGVGMAGAGLGIGTVAATCARVPAAELFSSALRVGRSDPLTLFGVFSLLLLAALIACYVPARGAMRTDLTNSLRCE